MIMLHEDMEKTPGPCEARTTQTRWVMLVDLRKCIGCGKCRSVCSQLNNAPWRTVIERVLAHNGVEKRFFLSMACMHCANPPCLRVCPTKATYQRSDGIVDVRNDICVGCGACIMACPYRARNMLSREKLTMQDGHILDIPDRIGISSKCNFCRPVIDAGLAKGMNPGIHEEATPRCVTHCISGALYFGNIYDRESEVHKITAENETMRFHEEMGTDPGVYFIIDKLF